MTTQTKTLMNILVQKFIKHLRINGGHLIGIFDIKMKTLRTLYLIFQIILHGEVAMDRLNCGRGMGL
jgi:hypothetical protein